MISVCKYFDECAEKNRLCFSEDERIFCRASIPLYEAENIRELALINAKKIFQSRIDRLEQRLKEAENARIKIQYNNREYTVSELCKRMAELERLLNQKETDNAKM